MSSHASSFAAGDRVLSRRFGSGQVIVDAGGTAVVRFDHGIEECEKATLQRLLTPLQAVELPEWHAPAEVIVRCLGEAIRSVNDAWGVFSRSRIALLPHQLWVCRQVNRTWPTRWLIADDVGLGKTIEAGLILLPLLSRGDVRRLLVLCPASLVEQWQYRMRTMFDIRLTAYTTAADTPNADFWNSNTQVIASYHTLRLDRSERHRRLIEADPWDLVIVDEAHHFNADEDDGPTLGYRLVEKLSDERRIRSLVFFTGTPHRGKNYGFLALLRLLRPDLFDPRRPLEGQLAHLPEVMIRNNKQNVTDLHGRRLFQAPAVSAHTYAYSPVEARFYEMLTEFILTGKAYARELAASEGRAVMLVLIAMQKLASSSVAAIRRALGGRLGRIAAGRQRLAELQAQLAQYSDLESEGDDDRLNRLDEQISELSAQVVLMVDEEDRLRELIAAADEVKSETKIQKVLSLLDEVFVGRPVLLFTEYKATQSLLMSTLIARFGAECATFINGDERADDVLDSSGRTRSFHEKRETAAEKFNSGRVRFLISTEAGGEGIDLQENCHSLIHVDLPWNPMRLHQRVGRLNRYGQKCRVDVITVRNPQTVESRIWDKLETKIGQIMRALQRVMDEPEDLMQLVLGMTSPALFREVFSEAADVAPERLSAWFDAKTARFGGHDALETVQGLIGNCARFDFQQASALIPKLDLPALRPFFTAMLEHNRRKVQEEGGALSFKTPDAWASEPGLRSSYQGMLFDRNGKDPQKVLGAGHKLIDRALAQAMTLAACVASLPSDVLTRPVIVCRITDRVTSGTGTVRAAVVGVERNPDASTNLLRDWELVQRLNELSETKFAHRLKPSAAIEKGAVLPCVEGALCQIQDAQSSLDLTFKVPHVEVLAVLWPHGR